MDVRILQTINWESGKIVLGMPDRMTYIFVQPIDALVSYDC